MKITEDVFYDEYKPLKNHFSQHAPFDGCMFETYGEEFAYLKKVNICQIWTIVDSESKLVIIPGFSIVNRLGYLITENKWEQKDFNNLHVTL